MEWPASFLRASGHREGGLEALDKVFWVIEVYRHRLWCKTTFFSKNMAAVAHLGGALKKSQPPGPEILVSKTYAGLISSSFGFTRCSQGDGPRTFQVFEVVRLEPVDWGKATDGFGTSCTYGIMLSLVCVIT